MNTPTSRADYFQCYCVLIEPAVVPGRIPVTNECRQNTHSPDNPFCETCEDRHPNLGVEVTTRPIVSH